MAKLTDEIKVKIQFKVNRELYDKIVAQAKKENLPGSVEDVLRTNCINWFKQWEKMFATGEVAMEKIEESKLVGVDGKPLIAGGGGGNA